MANAIFCNKFFGFNTRANNFEAAPEKFTPKEQVNVYVMRMGSISPKEKIALLKLLSPEAKAILWAQDKDRYYQLWLKLDGGYGLTLEEFSFMVEGDYKTYGSLINTCFNKSISEEIARYCFSKFDDERIKNGLKRCILREGMSAALLAVVAASENEDLKKSVAEWMTIFGQVKFVEKSAAWVGNGHELERQKADWKLFCQQTKDICMEAQRLMTYSLMEIFYATGHTMDPKAIASKFDIHNSDYSGADLIMKNEDREGVVNSEIESLISRDVNLRRLLLKIREHKKNQKASK
jgi:hypothetical protein